MRILLVEDETDLGLALEAMLRQAHYQVAWVASAQDAWTRLAEAEPDLLILDVMLPEGENAGFELARSLRQTGFTRPILFLTARDAPEDRVEGLDLGGDDYLTKPFDVSEFKARVRALLRRESQVKQNLFEQGPLRVDFLNRRVFWRQQEVHLSEKEYALLEVFTACPEKLFSVEELVERLFPNAGSGAQALRMAIARLRSRLGADIIVTLPGGYRLGIS